MDILKQVLLLQFLKRVKRSSFISGNVRRVWMANTNSKVHINKLLLLQTYINIKLSQILIYFNCHDEVNHSDCQVLLLVQAQWHSNRYLFLKKADLYMPLPKLTLNQLQNIEQIWFKIILIIANNCICTRVLDTEYEGK